MYTRSIQAFDECSRTAPTGSRYTNKAFTPLKDLNLKCLYMRKTPRTKWRKLNFCHGWAPRPNVSTNQWPAGWGLHYHGWSHDACATTPRWPRHELAWIWIFFFSERCSREGVVRDIRWAYSKQQPVKQTSFRNVWKQTCSLINQSINQNHVLILRCQVRNFENVTSRASENVGTLGGRTVSNSQWSKHLFEMFGSKLVL